jgi:hypothetical protein
VPPVWRAWPLLADGKLTMVAAPAGIGKTWVLHEVARAVAEGTSRAGIEPLRGTALIVDSELGRFGTVDRLRLHGWPEGIHVFDGTGLDLRRPEDRQLIRDAITELQPDYVGVDSLRAISGAAREDSSDDMSPIVRFLAEIAHGPDGGPAILLLHHTGWSATRGRGSSAIRDQVDAAFAMRKDENGAIEITCTADDLKAPNWGPAPRPIYVRIAPEGGLIGAEHETAAERYTRQLLAAMPVKTKTAAAKACTTERGKPATVNNPAWSRVWDDLERAGLLLKTPEGWDRNPDAETTEPKV